MHLDPFELHRPGSVAEVLELARGLGDAFDYVAGGTDLLPNYKMHLHPKAHLVALDRVAELVGFDATRIGAMTRLADLESDARFGRSYPGVLEAVREVATPLVRASGTVGGNLLVETRCFFFNQSEFWRESLGYCLKADGDRCHVVPQKERCYATFSGDLAPALIVLGAEVEIAGPDGVRRLSLEEMYDARGDGIRRHRLRPGELVVAVHVPASARGARAAYRKLRVRPSFDFPELGVAVALWGQGSHVERLEVALGGLETYPRRFPALTGPLAGTELTDSSIDQLAKELCRSVRPVHNTFLDPAYRKRMTEVYARRALRSARDGPAGTGAAT
ncbi:MAG TPA: FAD binding domain-containing protein [Thermoplasmata archaeon]|nr:FAD binding domain-containing protein [Thermoplasmata archaeon]